MRNKIRMVIKFYVLKGKTAFQINVKLGLKDFLGNIAPALSTTQTWITNFKRGRQSKEVHRSNRPNKVTNLDMVKKIKKF